ncbi:RNA helicase [Bacillus sp. BGMRC 2118]|nr:RNA helicase [Bacillus sp. BGMRC 2118]
MKTMVYYIQSGTSYIPFYEYSTSTIEQDEIYARQLCEFFIKDGREYELYSNEMAGDEEVLIIQEKGAATKFSNEKTYPTGIHMEIRQYRNIGEMTLLHTYQLNTHWEAIRYLLKDVIEVPGYGQMVRDSAEMDEDRKCYVVYVTNITE